MRPEFTIEQRPERILTMGSTASTLMWAAGATDAITARAFESVSDLGPAQAALEDAPLISNDADLTLKVILGQNPDLVITYGLNLTTQEDPAAAGIDSIVNSGFCDGGGSGPADGPVTFEGDVFSDIELYGRIAKQKVAELRQRVAAVAEQPPNPDITTAAAIGLDGINLRAYGVASLTHKQIETLGLADVVGDIQERLADVSVEEFIARDPDVVILLSGGGGVEEQPLETLRGLSAVAGVTAIRENRIIPLESPYLLGGPLGVDGLEAMAEAISATDDHRPGQLEQLTYPSKRRAPMSRPTTDSSRIGQTRTELELLMAGTAFVPARARAAEARVLLERDGAVILCGLPPQPDSLALAAAEVLGTRLTRLYPVRERRSDRDDLIQLHNDSHRVEVDVHGQTVALRDPDEDYVLIQRVHRAAVGGASLVADGYRVVDRLRDSHPGLWEFLTTVDVDFYGAWNPHRGVPNTPQVCRHVEWTRAGRRVVRANQGARPVWRGRAVHEIMAEQQETMLDLLADIRTAVASNAPRTVLEDGEILLIDNYRCWHGRDSHDTPRLTNIMTVRSTDAM